MIEFKPDIEKMKSENKQPLGCPFCESTYYYHRVKTRDYHCRKCGCNFGFQDGEVTFIEFEKDG